MPYKKNQKAYKDNNFSKENINIYKNTIDKEDPNNLSNIDNDKIEKQLRLKIISSFYPNDRLFLFPLKLNSLLGKKLVIFPDGRRQPVSDFLSVKPLQLNFSDLRLVCQQICEMVQVLMYSRKSSAKMDEIFINVHDSVQIYDLELSSRSKSSLQSRDFFLPQGPWRHCTLKDIISTHALGARLLLAFLLAIEHVVDHQDGINLIGCFENQRNNLDSNKTSVSYRMNSSYLEDDLKNISKSVLYSDRSSDIFCLSNGWSGGGSRNLSDLSFSHAISKERVRQVLLTACESIKKYSISISPPKKLLDAIKLMEMNSPFFIESAQQFFIDSGISSVKFHPYGVLNAAKFFGLSTPLVILKPGRMDIVCRPREADHIETLQSLGRSMARSFGLVNEQWVWARALEKNSSAKMSHVHMAMVCDKKLIPLVVDSTGNHWFWAGRSSIPNGTVVRPLKMIAFLGECGLKEILRDINSDACLADIFLPGPVSVEVIGALLIQWGMFEKSYKENCSNSFWTSLDSDGLRLCQSALPFIERQMAKIISDAGGAMERSVFKKIANDHAMNPNTVQSYLRRSPLFFRPIEKNNRIFLIK